MSAPAIPGRASDAGPEPAQPSPVDYLLLLEEASEELHRLARIYHDNPLSERRLRRAQAEVLSEKVDAILEALR